MRCKVIFGAVVILSGLTLVAAEKITREYDCCHLPLKIPINCAQNYELSIRNTSLVTARECELKVAPPFTAHGDNAVALDKCEDFDEKIFYINELGFADEKRIYYRGLPCNSTAPDNQSDRNIHIGVGVGVPLLVLAGIIGVGAIVYKCVCQRGNNNQAIYHRGKNDLDP